MKKFNDPQMSYWFSSDLHFGHANIVKYEKSNYKDVYHRDQDIVKRWNELVSPKDYAFLLGDIGLHKDIAYVRSMVAQLNGHLHFIKGNHCYRDHIKMYEEFGVYMGTLVNIAVMKQQISLCHFRMANWTNSHRGSWNLHGHQHCNFPDDKSMLQMDVGIQGNCFKPLNFCEIKTIMSKKDYVEKSHHR